MEDIEKEIILLIQNGTFQPESYLEDTIRFLQEKHHFLQSIDNLELAIRNDMADPTITTDITFNIVELISCISDGIIKITDLLLSIMPDNSHDIGIIDGTSYLDFITYENYWLVSINQEMMQDLRVWIISHNLEVQDKKRNLERILDSIQSKEVQLIINNANMLFDQRRNRLIHNASTKHAKY